VQLADVFSRDAPLVDNWYQLVNLLMMHSIYDGEDEHMWETLAKRMSPSICICHCLQFLVGKMFWGKKSRRWVKR